MIYKKDGKLLVKDGKLCSTCCPTCPCTNDENQTATFSDNTGSEFSEHSINGTHVLSFWYETGGVCFWKKEIAEQVQIIIKYSPDSNGNLNYVEGRIWGNPGGGENEDWITVFLYYPTGTCEERISGVDEPADEGDGTVTYCPGNYPEGCP